MDRGRIVAGLWLDPKTHQATLKQVLSARLLLTKPTHLTIAGVIADDFTGYSGQSLRLAVTGGKFFSQKFQLLNAIGNFPLSGPPQTIDNNVKIGSLTMSAKGSNLILSTSDIEDINIHQIILRGAGGNIATREKNYSCTLTSFHEFEVCNFEPPLLITKGKSVSLKTHSGKVLLPNIYDYDLIAYGANSGYQIAPTILKENRPLPAGGAQPWRLNPLWVAEVDGGRYGFQYPCAGWGNAGAGNSQNGMATLGGEEGPKRSTPCDIFTLISQSTTEGVAKVKVVHKNRISIIELVEGNNNTWKIKKVEENKTR